MKEPTINPIGLDYYEPTKNDVFGYRDRSISILIENALKNEFFIEAIVITEQYIKQLIKFTYLDLIDSIGIDPDSKGFRFVEFLKFVNEIFSLNNEYLLLFTRITKIRDDLVHNIIFGDKNKLKHVKNSKIIVKTIKESLVKFRNLYTKSFLEFKDNTLNELNYPFNKIIGSEIKTKILEWKKNLNKKEEMKFRLSLYKGTLIPSIIADKMYEETKYDIKLSNEENVKTIHNKRINLINEYFGFIKR